MCQRKPTTVQGGVDVILLLNSWSTSISFGAVWCLCRSKQGLTAFHHDGHYVRDLLEGGRVGIALDEVAL